MAAIAAAAIAASNDNLRWQNDQLKAMSELLAKIQEMVDIENGSSEHLLKKLEFFDPRYDDVKAFVGRAKDYVNRHNVNAEWMRRNLQLCLSGDALSWHSRLHDTDRRLLTYGRGLEEWEMALIKRFKVEDTVLQSASYYREPQQTFYYQNREYQVYQLQQYTAPISSVSPVMASQKRLTDALETPQKQSSSRYVHQQQQSPSSAPSVVKTQSVSAQQQPTSPAANAQLQLPSPASPALIVQQSASPVLLVFSCRLCKAEFNSNNKLHNHVRECRLKTEVRHPTLSVIESSASTISMTPSASDVSQSHQPSQNHLPLQSQLSQQEQQSTSSAPIARKQLTTASDVQQSYQPQQSVKLGFSFLTDSKADSSITGVIRETPALIIDMSFTTAKISRPLFASVDTLSASPASDTQQLSASLVMTSQKQLTDASETSQKLFSRCSYANAQQSFSVMAEIFSRISAAEILLYASQHATVKLPITSSTSTVSNEWWKPSTDTLSSPFEPMLEPTKAYSWRDGEDIEMRNASAESTFAVYSTAFFMQKNATIIASMMLVAELIFSLMTETYYSITALTNQVTLYDGS